MSRYNQGYNRSGRGRKKRNNNNNYNNNNNDYQSQQPYNDSAYYGGYDDNNNNNNNNNYRNNSQQYNHNQKRHYSNKTQQKNQQKYPQTSGNNDNNNNFGNTDDCIRIDGSIMEGGGQILRNSMTLSALLTKPIHIRNIRGQRSTPGLRKQHSKGLQLIQSIQGGTLQGNYVKSMEITYYPSEKPSFKTHHRIDIETAGSVALLIQVALPLLVFSSLNCTLECMGGTNASFAPQLDWFELVLQPMLKKLMGIDMNISCLQRGFFPKGGGHVILQTNVLKQSYLPAFDLTNRGRKIKRIYGRCVVAGRSMHLDIGNVMVKGAIREIQSRFGKNIDIKIDVKPKDKLDSFSDGVGLVVVLETDTGCLFGGSSLGGPQMIRKGKGKGGKKNKRRGYNDYNNNNDDHGNESEAYYEELGRVAVRELHSDFTSTKQGCTDRWLQDQLIIFMALAKGKSKMKTCAMEMHTQTAIHFCEMMTGVKFDVTHDKDGTVVIECEGIAYEQHKFDHYDNEIVSKKIVNDDDTKQNHGNDGNDGYKKKKKNSEYLTDRPSFF